MVQTAINFARQEEISIFNKNKLDEFLSDISSYCSLSLEDIHCGLKEKLKECGIIYVVLPKLNNCNVKGAIKWLTKERVVLAMVHQLDNIQLFGMHYFMN